jgi:hypothetical protein
MIMTEPPIPPAQWFRLPLTLRRRYWTETNYGRKDPSRELATAIREAVVALDAPKE